MENLRLQQLVFMFAYITNMSAKEAKDIILETDTGKAVQNDNPAVMYEQQTENLYCIATELHGTEKYDSLSNSFTVESIVQAMEKLNLNAPLFNIAELDKEFSFFNPESPEEHRIQSKKRQKNMLQTKRQNQLNAKINARRIENADKSKR